MALMVPWRTFNIHWTLPFPKKVIYNGRFFRLIKCKKKGSLKNCLLKGSLWKPPFLTLFIRNPRHFTCNDDVNDEVMSDDVWFEDDIDDDWNFLLVFIWTDSWCWKSQTHRDTHTHTPHTHTHTHTHSLTDIDSWVHLERRVCQRNRSSKNGNVIITSSTWKCVNHKNIFITWNKISINWNIVKKNL